MLNSIKYVLLKNIQVNGTLHLHMWFERAFASTLCPQDPWLWTVSQSEASLLLRHTWLWTVSQSEASLTALTNTYDTLHTHTYHLVFEIS